MRGILSGLIASSIWGGMYVVSKVVLEVIPPFSLLAIRLLLGIFTLGVMLLFQYNYKREKKLPTRCEIRDFFLVGVVGYGISLGFQFVGTKLSTASNGALVTSATPAFVLLFAPFLLHEANTPRRIFALIISTLGVVAVIDPRNAELSPALFRGNLSLLAAALSWALYSVMVRKVSQNSNLLLSSAVMLAGGLPSSLLFGVWENFTLGIGDFTPGVIVGILYLGIISTAIAMFLWNYAFAVLPAAVASLTFFAQPLVGAFLGWLFLKEQITPLFLIGGVLIGVGLVISNAE